MRTRRTLTEQANAAVFAHWRGRPLYILLVYLVGQLMIDPLSFLATVLFLSYTGRVSMRDFVLPSALSVGILIVLVYVFYHTCSPAIRRFLAAQIAGELPDPDMAMAAWREAVTYPQKIVVRVIAASPPFYLVPAILLAPRVGLYQALIGWITATTATVALTQVMFLFYLEWAMGPVAQLALAAGARPDLDDIRQTRLRLRTKMLLLFILIIVVPVVIVGLFGYGQVVGLGGDPTRSLWLTGLVALIANGVAIGLALLLVRSVATPIRQMQDVMEEIGRGNLKVAALPLTTDELAELGLHFNQMVDRLRQNEQLTAAFGRYVSPTVRDGILSGQIALGGERREITILFSDVRNFTTWCEREEPESVIQTLNSYYENLVQALLKHGGTVTRFTGDGVLALFGAPLGDPDHALHAVQAAWEASTLLDKFNDIRHTLDAFELRTGFGIHTGPAVVGSIGCEARAEYTPIGDPANVASRIEGLNKELGTSILISDDTYQRVAELVQVGQRAEVTVKGRTQPVRVVEVVGLMK